MQAQVFTISGLWRKLVIGIVEFRICCSILITKNYLTNPGLFLKERAHRLHWIEIVSFWIFQVRKKGILNNLGSVKYVLIRMKLNFVVKIFLNFFVMNFSTNPRIYLKAGPGPYFKHKSLFIYPELLAPDIDEVENFNFSNVNELLENLFKADQILHLS